MSSPSSPTPSNEQEEPLRDTDVDPEDARFTPEEEKERLAEALTHKETGNRHFTSSPPDYILAISSYESALSSCPKYLHEPRAIFYANISACYIKLEKWKEAEEAATSSLIESGDEDPPEDRRVHREKMRAAAAAKNAVKDSNGNKRQRPKKVRKGQTLEDGIEFESSDDNEEEEDEFEDAVEDQNDNNTTTTTGGNKNHNTKNKKKEEKEEKVEEIPREEMKQTGNWKARFRRARAREKQMKWGSLTGAMEDYTLLVKYPPKPPQQTPIPAADMRTIRSALIRLPPLIERKKKEEVDEMMGKLKELGNGFLRPFGLSTDNFGMTQTEGGGYSLSFNQNPGK